MANLIKFGYKGKIYPINLKNPEIMGIKAYPRLDDIPDNIDHVIYCIALENLPAFLDSCSKKGVRSVHVFSARGAETGSADARELEAETKKRARAYGIRLLGPNCMGIYCPESGISFCTNFSSEKGNVGAMIQSGGSSTDVGSSLARFQRGVAKVNIYVGNLAVDVTEEELRREFMAFYFVGNRVFFHKK